MDPYFQHVVVKGLTHPKFLIIASTTVCYTGGDRRYQVLYHCIQLFVPSSVSERWMPAYTDTQTERQTDRLVEVYWL